MGSTGGSSARGDGALLKRLLIIGLFVGIAYAYIGPVRDYMGQKEQLRLEQVALIKARAIRDAISLKLRALKEPQVLETRARELGMVRPGETPYAVQGIKHPAVPSRPADDGTTGVWGFISGIID